MPFHFSTTYTSLPPAFHQAVQPTPVTNPRLVRWNGALAQELGLGEAREEQWAQWLGGNELPAGATPLAMAYAGHQFGGFNMLGDGRAILLGEHMTPNGRRCDVQLKGAGPTPFARRGDGRATLHAMLREFVVSEAMHHLGIPTTRSLAVVATGEAVFRRGPEPGGILTRIAASHLRVGTMEYAAQFLGKPGLEALVEYTLQRHYPHSLNSENQSGEASKPLHERIAELNPPPAGGLGGATALTLLQNVLDRQVQLLVHWMRVGFIHGVLNTDNVALSGETIDYGPCAFMNAYNPATVFSSIDTNGRYAFGNQPPITHWNLAALAGALLPAIHEDQNEAVALAQAVINTFPSTYETAWQQMMNAKLGLRSVHNGDAELTQDLLAWMQAHKADYTNTFAYLCGHAVPEEQLFQQDDFVLWQQRWRQRLGDGQMADARALMRTQNPVFIARNHLVEQALEAAVAGQFGPMDALLEGLRQPYDFVAGKEQYQQPPLTEAGYATFCNT